MPIFVIWLVKGTCTKKIFQIQILLVRNSRALISPPLRLYFVWNIARTPAGSSTDLYMFVVRWTRVDCLIIISFCASNSFLRTSKFHSMIHDRLTWCTRIHLKFTIELVALIFVRFSVTLEGSQIFWSIFKLV